MLSLVLRQLAPRRQLESNPAAIVLAVFTLALTAGVVALCFMGRAEWHTVLIVCGVLWLVMILSAWCTVRFPHWNWQPPNVEDSDPQDSFTQSELRIKSPREGLRHSSVETKCTPT